MRISAHAPLVAAISLVLGACGSDIVPAPPTRYLPLAPNAVIAADLVTENSVIGASDPRRFRSMDIASAHPERARADQGRDPVLLGHGWKHLQVTTCCKTTPSGIGEEGTAVPASITNPSATVQLDSPSGNDYVSMNVVAVDPRRSYLNDPRQGDRMLVRVFRDHEGLVDVSVAARSS